MRKFLEKYIPIMIFLIVSVFTITYSITYATSEGIEKSIIEKSESFSQWEELKEDERELFFQPPYFDINLKDSVKRSTYNEYLGESEEPVIKFNLKKQLENIGEIIVKDQKLTQSCWAFSYSSVIETTIANKYKRPVLEYSPMHIDYVAASLYNRKAGIGGTQMMSLAYGASGLGPVYENDFSFESVYNEKTNIENPFYLSDINKVDLTQQSSARIESATKFASIYKTYTEDSITYKDSKSAKANVYEEDEVQALRKLIKTHIKENGAVAASIYSDFEQTGETTFSSIGGFFNPTKNAYYVNDPNYKPNHAVTIVGWDDEFSKDNFVLDKKPLKDGAYIVLNSYGSNFGSNGYFYMSYEDAFIETTLYGIDEIVEKETDNQKFYDNLYEYDELGANYGLYSINENRTAYLDSGYAANVFKRKDKQCKEYLSEVGIFLLSTQGIEIYVNSVDEKLENCTLVGTYTGSNALEAGYHTLKLASPIELTGEKFVIKIKYINSERTTIPIESNLLQSGLSSVDNQYDTAVSNKGESFISYEGTKWHDLYDYKVSSSITLKNTNACIKAFTTISKSEPIVEATGITLDKDSLNLEVGEKVSLVATVLPEETTNKDVIWESDNINVVTISNGLIEAIGEGIATITVKTQDGKFVDTCAITVEKITENPNLGQPEIPAPEVTEPESGVTQPEPGVSEPEPEVTEPERDDSSSDEPSIVAVTGVKLDKNSLNMEVGQKTNLVATITPLDATNKEVIWKSSNEEIATISDNGIIEALKSGKAVITVTTRDGNFTASSEITISEKTNTEDDIYVEKEPAKIEQVEDATTIEGTIPRAGEKTIIGIAIIITIVMIVCYKKYKKIKKYKIY